MEIADQTVGSLEPALDAGADPGIGLGVPGAVPNSRESEHDTRSLVVAILACALCWAALGYYLLT